MVWNQQVRTNHPISNGLWLAIRSETHPGKKFLFGCYPDQGELRWNMLQVIWKQNKWKNICDWNLPNPKFILFSCTFLKSPDQTFDYISLTHPIHAYRNDVHIICSPHQDTKGQGHSQLSSQPVSHLVTQSLWVSEWLSEWLKEWVSQWVSQ